VSLKRIIFTVTNDLTYDQRMQRICTTMAGGGYEVLLVGRKLRSSMPITNEAFQQHRMRLLFVKGKLFYLEYNIRLFFFLLTHSFDIVCGIDLDSILPCYFAAFIKRKKCVYDAHELFPEVPEVVNRPFIKKTWQAVEKFAVKKIPFCYTVSAGLAQYFYDKYQRQFDVIRNFPLLSEANLLETSQGLSGSSYLLYQGALNEGRGLEALIEAMKEVPLQLIIIGEGDLSSELRNAAKQQGLNEKIIFNGRKLPVELAGFTHAAFAGMNLLENRGLSYYYSLANKFFDYVHAAVPVITMRFPEYVSLNGTFEVALLIENTEPQSIRAAVEKLIQDKDYYFRLRENCLVAREEWNWQKEQRKLLAFYQQL
jgi:glycosyltransferase involved in cell wall biosynthesis